MNNEEWLEARKGLVTSTDVAALMGDSSYKTHRELWIEKHEETANQITENEKMKWGQRLEAVVAHNIAADHGIDIVKCNDFSVDQDLRLGCSFDYIATGEHPAIFEVKTTGEWAYKKSWQGKVPKHIWWQVQTQMLLSGFNKAYVAVLVGGQESHLFAIDADKDAHNSIINAVETFWKSNCPPEQDNTPQVVEENIEIDSGELVDLCAEYLINEEIKDQAERDLKEIKKRIDEITKGKNSYHIGCYQIERKISKGSAGKVITQDMIGQVINARKPSETLSIKIASYQSKAA